jgi:hypothetical protein
MLEVFSVLGEVQYDPLAQEYHAKDSDGVTYWGDDPAQVAEQWAGDMRCMAEHASKCGDTVQDQRAQRRSWREWRVECSSQSLPV